MNSISVTPPLPLSPSLHQSPSHASSPTPAPIEWCHRRLLARIHRLTMEGLRKQIEPVTVDVFFRFLTRHHGLVHGSKRGGAGGLFETIGMLQGLDIPAIAWERDLLAARLENYRPEWLDELCLTGEVGWGRLFPTRRMPDRSRPMASLTRAAPLSLFLRGDLDWLQAASVPGEFETLSSPAREVYTLLSVHGAMFASDLMSATRMLPDQLNDVLGELVSQGMVTADGFAGLRALLAARVRESESQLPARFARRRVPLAGAGRWALWRRGMEETEREGDGERGRLGEGETRRGGDDLQGRPRRVEDHATTYSVSPTPPLPHSPTSHSVSPSSMLAANHDRIMPAGAVTTSATEHWAWQLLRRWGVVFRDLLEREAGAPRWFELLQVYRRLEARGEIRGGRFISGVAGEQFAVGDTVRQLRQLRDAGPARELVVISASDPLNLVGILTPHERVPSIASHRIAWLDGFPVAALVAQELKFLVEPTPELRLLLEGGKALWRRAGRAAERNEQPIDRPEDRKPPATRRRQKSLFVATGTPPLRQKGDERTR